MRKRAKISFFGALKRNVYITTNIKTRAEAKRMTVEYIEEFYNCIKRHAKIDNLILDDFFPMT